MTTIIVLVVILLVVLAAGAWLVQRQRTARLRQRFGDEYDRTLERSDNRRQAEQSLAEVADRRDTLNIRPLTAQEREAWLLQWRQVQARFVDAPAEAVATARDLLPALMRDRGYPVDDFEERATLLATDHPVVVGEYRAAEDAYQRHQATGGSSTESLRQALVHYRALFEALVEPGADDGADTGRPDADRPADVHRDAVDSPGVDRDVVDGGDVDRGAGPVDATTHGRHADATPVDERVADNPRGGTR